MRDPDKARGQLADILRGGVDVFVSLISELPPQWEHNGKIAGFVGYHAPVLELATGDDPRYPVEPREVKFLHYPIDDLTAPGLGQLRQIVDDLSKEVAAGRKLYIHCWGGRGRAGTVGASLIGKMEGLTADEALERIQQAYSARDQDSSMSPETSAQVKLVRTYLDR